MFTRSSHLETDGTSLLETDATSHLETSAAFCGGRGDSSISVAVSRFAGVLWASPPSLALLSKGNLALLHHPPATLLTATIIEAMLTRSIMETSMIRR